MLSLEKVEQVNRLVETGVSIGGLFESVLPLTQPTTKISLSNVPPFISDEFLSRELSRHGKIVSPIKKVLSGCKSPLLKHVVSHRRQFDMILQNRTEEFNVRLHVRVDDFDYVLFATSSVMKCFGCGGEGHMVKACPNRDGSAPLGSGGGGALRPWTPRLWDLAPGGAEPVGGALLRADPVSVPRVRASLSVAELRTALRAHGAVRDRQNR